MSTVTATAAPGAVGCYTPGAMVGRITVLAVTTVLVLAAPAIVAAGPPDGIAGAIGEACRIGEPRFHLIVHRTDGAGERSLEVFPSGVGIWNRAVQITLSDEVRAALLGILHDRGFAAMAPSYGGQAKPGLKRAALRVTCRVALELDGLERASAQLADGEQSAELAALADALLDLVEPLAGEGVSAAGLSDGLRKLVDGRLAAETLRVRLVRLPEGGGEGEILSIGAGVESRKAYAPGRRIGEERVATLRSERLAAIVKALLEADVASLPVNLWSAEHVEFEVGILNHRTSVIGRDFSRLSSEDHRTVRERFERLVGVLLESPGPR